MGRRFAVVKEILGHTSVEMTMRYTHVSPQVARACVQALSTTRSPSVPTPVGHQVATKVPTARQVHPAMA
jgi:hypothetical protein